jgi:HAE1 family hydrophobic/amphiphilic exporter-1
VEGVAGQLFRDQSLTITFAMLISLVVAMTLIPMMASLEGRSPLAFRDEPESMPRSLPKNRILRALVRGGRFVGELLFHWIPRSLVILVGFVATCLDRSVGAVLRWLGRRVVSVYDASARGYHRMLPGAMDRPWLVLGAAALAFAISIALIPTLGMNLIPSLAQGQFEATIKLPPGTPLAQIELQHARDPNIASIYGVAGVGTRLDASPTESGENSARLLVTLKSGAGDREEAEAMKSLRASLAQRPDLEVKFARPALFSFSTPLEIEIRGYDLDALTRSGKKLAEQISASDRFADIKSTVEDGYPEVQIRFDQDRAAALGLTTRQISDAVVGKVRGEVATRYNFRDRKIDVLTRLRETDRASVNDIRNLVVNPGAERPIHTRSRSSFGAAGDPRIADAANARRCAPSSSASTAGPGSNAASRSARIAHSIPSAALARRRAPSVTGTSRLFAVRAPTSHAT